MWKFVNFGIFDKDISFFLKFLWKTLDRFRKVGYHNYSLKILWSFFEVFRRKVTLMTRCETRVKDQYISRLYRNGLLDSRKAFCPGMRHFGNMIVKFGSLFREAFGYPMVSVWQRHRIQKISAIISPCSSRQSVGFQRCRFKSVRGAILSIIG